MHIINCYSKEIPPEVNYEWVIYRRFFSNSEESLWEFYCSPIPEHIYGPQERLTKPFSGMTERFNRQFAYHPVFFSSPAEAFSHLKNNLPNRKRFFLFPKLKKAVVPSPMIPEPDLQGYCSYGLPGFSIKEGKRTLMFSVVRVKTSFMSSRSLQYLELDYDLDNRSNEGTPFPWLDEVRQCTL